MVNWYFHPQVHTSKLMDDAVPASLKQGEGLSSCAWALPSLTLPRTECRPRLPLLHRVVSWVGGGGSPLHLQLPPSTSTNSFLPLLPKDHGTEIRQT